MACTDDCSLNGVCTADGQCQCDPGWYGPTCASLRLLPAKKGAGLQSVDEGRPTSSWGGVVNKLPSGRWGMIAAQMVHHCGIDSWTRENHSLATARELHVAQMQKTIPLVHL